MPPPGRFFGLVEDDLNLNTDPNSITFGEKRPAPGIPISVRDYTFRTMLTINTDENGFYEVLLPSTYTALCPVPGGICPGMYVLVVNDPGDVSGQPRPELQPALPDGAGRARHLARQDDPVRHAGRSDRSRRRLLAVGRAYVS